jgi:hypothetical protein
MSIVKYLEVKYTPAVKQITYQVRVVVPNDFTDDQIMHGVDRLLNPEKGPNPLPLDTERVAYVNKQGRLSLDFIDSEESPALTLELEPRYFFDCTVKAESITRFTADVKADSLKQAREKLEEYLEDQESEANNTNSPIWEFMSVDSTDSTSDHVEPSDITRFGRKVSIGDE